MGAKVEGKIFQLFSHFPSEIFWMRKVKILAHLFYLCSFCLQAFHKILSITSRASSVKAVLRTKFCTLHSLQEKSE
ncbi:hypothetical protein X975_07938, partial [Stegodyphus mimosarum]